MNEHIFHTDLGDIHYWIRRVNGDAPWLVFLPGLSADHTLFERQIAYFSASYHCFVWDAPAHGLSRPFKMRFTMRDMVRYLHKIFAREGVKSPFLVGQSLGGYISQVYIDEYPDAVSGFVSIDSCPMSQKYYSWWELALLRRTKWMYMSIPYKLLLKWGIAGTARTPYGRELMEKTWSVYNKAEYCTLADYGYRILVQAIEEKNEYPISCPVLLICGEKDAAGSAKSYNRKWERLDGHRLVWIKGAGHNANTDASDEVNALIETFVRKSQQ